MKKLFKVAATVAAMVLALSLFAACDDDDDDDDDTPPAEDGNGDDSGGGGETVEVVGDTIDTTSFTVSSTPAVLVDSDTVAKIISAGGTLYIEFTYTSSSGWLSLYSDTNWSDELAAWTGYSDDYTLKVTSSGYTVYDSNGSVATESYASSEVTGTSPTLNTYSSSGIYLAAEYCTLGDVYWEYPSVEATGALSSTVTVYYDASESSIVAVYVGSTQATYDSDAGTYTYTDTVTAGLVTVISEYELTVTVSSGAASYTYEAVATSSLDTDSLVLTGVDWYTEYSVDLSECTTDSEGNTISTPKVDDQALYLAGDTNKFVISEWSAAGDSATSLSIECDASSGWFGATYYLGNSAASTYDTTKSLSANYPVAYVKGSSTNTGTGNNWNAPVAYLESMGACRVDNYAWEDTAGTTTADTSGNYISAVTCTVGTGGSVTWDNISTAITDMNFEIYWVRTGESAATVYYVGTTNADLD